MKNIYVLVVIFFCFSELGTSQTEAEKQDIISTYNPLAVKKLQKSIIENSEKNLTVSFNEKSTPTSLSDLNGS